MYQILIKKRAKKFFDKLPATEKRRIVEAIERLPEGEDIKKLRGYESVLRLRVVHTALFMKWIMTGSL